jgi:C4-type Zn-finger protein
LDFVEKKNDFGIEILYKVAHQQDKERPVIHSENASITITELDHEISLSTKSQQTTIKGIL